jgi:hypothetical protein
MNINYIHIKKIFIGLLLLVTGYVTFLLIASFISKPDELKLDFAPIQASANLSNNIEVNQISSNTPSTFDYKVIGYRAGSSRSSIIVERNNQTFVVQQGELLENRYKLVSVDNEYAIFKYNGKSLQLSTNLTSEK